MKKLVWILTLLPSLALAQRGGAIRPLSSLGESCDLLSNVAVAVSCAGYEKRRCIDYTTDDEYVCSTVTHAWVRLNAAIADTASDLTCTNCIGPTEISDLTLGTDTAGNYVETLTAGTGVAITGADAEAANKTVALDYTSATGSSGLGAGICRFDATVCSNAGGIVCEGSASNTIQGALCWPSSMVSADKTWTLPTTSPGTFVISTSSSTSGPAGWAANTVSCSTACTNIGMANCQDSIPLDGTNAALGNCTGTTGNRLCLCR